MMVHHRNILGMAIVITCHNNHLLFTVEQRQVAGPAQNTDGLAVMEIEATSSNHLDRRNPTIKNSCLKDLWSVANQVHIRSLTSNKLESD